MPAVALGSWTRLLSQPIGADNREHLVQFYEDEDFLYELVTLFAGSGLEQGDAVIIIAIPSHRAAFEKHLQAKGIDVADVQARGQLTLLDAADTLAQFLVNGVPNPEKFINIIGHLLEEKRAQYRAVRAYGEIVDLLWTEGNLHGTIQLEQLWNDLAKALPFTLLCGYGIGKFNQQMHSRAFHKVCQTHTHVIPAEGFAKLSDAESQRRMIASLQQQAKALQTEIVERKKIEKSLQEALHLRDEFLSIASHELKTPLTSLSLQLQILQRALAKGYGPGLAEKVKIAIQNSDQQVKRLNKFIDQLLDLTRFRLGRLRLELVLLDLAKLTQDVIGRLDQTAAGEELGHSASIEVRSTGPILGRWDQARIEQVIMNLITNALKYGKGDPIEVRLSLDESRSLVRLAIRDHGIGISLEDQARLFKRFKRSSVENYSGGLGLGLYIVHQIVDAHGGTIQVQSRPGDGATFTVELPLNISGHRQLQSVKSD